MRFGVLGPLAVWTDDGAPVRVPGLKVRALLADLLVHEGRPAAVDRLVDDLWGEAAPANPTGALQVRVSQLRRALDDAEAGARALVVSGPAGYLLRAGPEAVDAARFAALVERAQATDDPRCRATLLSDALALWRGAAYADFADEAWARATAAGLEEQRLAVLEERAEARLALGQHSSLAGELRDLVSRHPLRERLRAVHMRALYRAGRQSEALESYGDLRRHLADELGLDPSPGLVALQQGILEQDASLAAPPAQVARPARQATNLPRPLTELIGRDQAIADVRSLLAVRHLVTLTGSGGVGKTRLAVEAARAMVETFPDGVWLVELAALDRCDDRDADNGLAEMVMATLEIRTTPADRGPLRDRLAAALRHRRLLLVLDNCEHLARPVAAFAESLLQAVPGVRVLATSRQPLDVAGEVVWEVPPLEVPGTDATRAPADLLRSSAVQLFVTRATAGTRGFSLDADTAPAVAQLCRRLDGIPLALELAATRVRGLGVNGLVARLDDRFRLLTTGYQGAPSRQRTLGAVIDWSWELLTDTERRVLRRLAVHADGCTLEAAEAVCAGDDVPAEDVLDVLTGLVDRSLVVMDERAGDGPRYRLLESVSAYCSDRMREVGELAQVRRRHADHYLDLAVRADPQLRGRGQRHWLRRLDADTANLRAALDTLIRSGAAEDALRLAGALTWYWHLRGRHAEARRSLAATLAVPGDASAAVRAGALAWHAGITALQGETDAWATSQRGALDLYATAGDPIGHARAQWFLALVGIELGELDSGEALAREALATFRTHGDRWGEASALTLTAKLAHVRGDIAALERDARQSARIFGELGDQWGVLQATDWLIGLAEMTGDYERATQLGKDGLRMADELGLWPDAAGRLAWLGWIALELCDYVQAREYCEQALRLATEQGFQAAVSTAKLGMAFAARRDGKLDVAEEELRDLIELARDHASDAGQALYLSMVQIELGYLAAQRGDAATALGLHLEGFDVAQARSAARDVAWALVGIAAALAVDERHAEAAQMLGTAAEIQRSTGLPTSPSDRADVDRTTAVVRAALGDDAFAAAFERGGRLAPADARAIAARD
jgi:predicted ATPase/DNA-binding SARP family transcriptional activator